MIRDAELVDFRLDQASHLWLRDPFSIYPFQVYLCERKLLAQ